MLCSEVFGCNIFTLLYEYFHGYIYLYMYVAFCSAERGGAYIMLGPTTLCEHEYAWFLPKC